jgi:glutaredoxin
MSTFLIYSKPGCPYCVKIKQVMDLKELKHVLYTLDQDFTKEEFYNKFGNGSTFPQVVYNDQNLGGCVDTIKYLKENNII